MTLCWPQCIPGWPVAAGFERWAGKRTGNYGQFRGLRQPSGTAGSGAVNAPDPAVAATRRTGLLRSTAVFSAMTFQSRISGLVRDQVYAAVFGAWPAMDAFVVAFRIPRSEEHTSELPSLMRTSYAVFCL